MTDIIIVGCGTAGMTAAVYALRNNKTVLILESEAVGGQIAFSPCVENFPTYKSISGEDLSNKMFEQVLDLGAQFELEDVQKIQKGEDGIFTVTTDYGVHQARAVVIATGAKQKHIGIAAEDKLLGKGVYYCAICDGAFYKGKEVMVIGDGNTALQYAILLSSYCKKVYVYTLFDKFFGDDSLVKTLRGKDNVEVRPNTSVTDFIGENELTSVEYKDKDGNVTIEGAVSRGVPEDKAAKIFDDMADFAKYAFNKSHAAAYAVVAYQTAYLKALYPQEFLAAVLNNRIDNISEITKYVMYMKERNIEVLPPDINKSKAYFSVENKAVRIGLVAIKGVGKAAIDSIIEEREKNGDYKSFEDFISRCDSHALNKRLVENLILAGAFDKFKVYRSRLVQVSGELIDMASTIAKQRESAQMSLFGTVLEETPLKIGYPNIPEYDDRTRLNNEKAVLGVFISGHPLEKYLDSFKKYSFDLSVMNDYEEDEEGKIFYPNLEDGAPVRMGGLITAISKKTTKTGQGMAFATLEDIYSSIEIVFFPKVYERYKDKIEVDAIVEISGKLQLRDGEKPSVTVDKITTVTDADAGVQVAPEKPVAVKKPDLLCVVIDDESVCDEVIDIINSYPGEVETYLKIDGKRYKLGCKCRMCKGLQYELMGLVDEKNIIFVQNQ